MKSEYHCSKSIIWCRFCNESPTDCCWHGSFVLRCRTTAVTVAVGPTWVQPCEFTSLQCLFFSLSQTASTITNRHRLNRTMYRSTVARSTASTHGSIQSGRSQSVSTHLQGRLVPSISTVATNANDVWISMSTMALTMSALITLLLLLPLLLQRNDACTSIVWHAEFPTVGKQHLLCIEWRTSSCPSQSYNTHDTVSYIP